MAIYYDCLKYQDKNLDILEKTFNLIRFSSPKFTDFQLIKDAEVIFAPLVFKFDNIFFKKLPRLKAIVSNTTGIPHINESDCAMQGIKIIALHDDSDFLQTITPTAEHNIGLIISCARRIPAAHNSTIRGYWDRRPWGSPKMLSRMTLGIVGYGRLGRKVGTIARAIGMQVEFYDPFCDGSMTSLLELAKISDVLNINAKVTEKTKKMVSQHIIEAMPKNSILINTARGEILDENALVDNLENGHLWGAALDTIDGEFDDNFIEYFSKSRILNYAKNHDNLILTPHIGGSTIDAWTETEHRVISKLCKFFSGMQ